MTAGWFKATASSDNASCVKVRFEDLDVLLGDTKNDHLGDREPVIRLSGEQWERVIEAWRELPPGSRSVSFRVPDALSVVVDGEGNTIVTAGNGGVELSFSANELDAFLDGVHKGEFDRAWVGINPG